MHSLPFIPFLYIIGKVEINNYTRAITTSLSSFNEQITERY